MVAFIKQLLSASSYHQAYHKPMHTYIATSLQSSRSDKSVKETQLADPMIAPFLRAKEVGTPPTLELMNIYIYKHPAAVGAAVVRNVVAIIRNLNLLMGEAITCKQVSPCSYKHKR